MKSPAPRPGTKPNAWFKDSLFNLLVDYYPEVAFRPYGSAATPENVVPVLKELQPGCIIIYAKGHSGTTTFPSVLKTEHPMLGRDMPKAFRDYCDQAGTRLFIYYSGLLDGIAGQRHPEWRMRDRDGKDLQYLKEFNNFIAYANCPLSGYFEEWVAVHLRELIKRCRPDGFWIDGDWAGPCYCPRCEARYRAETGLSGPMPEYNLLTPEGRAWSRVWTGIMHEWRLKFNRLIKALKPDCMYSAGNVSSRAEFMEPFDWRSGDWFSPNNHRLHMSVMARRYATTGLPYDAYTCDTSFVHSREQMRARTKTLPRMLQEGATLLANGAQWGYWTYPSGPGAFVPSRMRLAAQAAAFARERREICLHSDYVPTTAVLNPERSAYTWNEVSSYLMGAGKALIALHRDPIYLDEVGLGKNEPWELIVLPEVHGIPATAVKRLERYVRNGGRLLSIGDAALDSPELQALLGIRLAKAAAFNDGHVFRADHEPTGVFANWDRYKLTGARELYPLFLSWDHANPDAAQLRNNWPMHGQVDEEQPELAGMPAATVRKLGKGLAVHVATNLFSQYWQYGNPDQLVWLRELFSYMLPEPRLVTDAPGFVELSLRRQDDNVWLLHAVNGNPGRDISLVGSEDWWVDDIPAVGPYTFRLRCPQKPVLATWEPGRVKAQVSWKKGVLTAVLPRLEIHACLRLEIKARSVSPARK